MPDVTSFQLHPSWESPSTTRPCSLQLPLLTPTAWFGLLSVQGLCEDPDDLLLFILPNVTSLLTSPVALSWGDSVPCPQQSSCGQGQPCPGSRKRRQVLPVAQDLAAASFSRSFHPHTRAASSRWHQGPSPAVHPHHCWAVHAAWGRASGPLSHPCRTHH